MAGTLASAYRKFPTRGALCSFVKPKMSHAAAARQTAAAAMIKIFLNIPQVCVKPPFLCGGACGAENGAV